MSEQIRCFFCGGNIHMGRCIMCARTTDIQHELYVEVERKRDHKNWQSWSGQDAYREWEKPE